MDNRPAWMTAACATSDAPPAEKRVDRRPSPDRRATEEHLQWRPAEKLGSGHPATTSTPSNSGPAPAAAAPALAAAAAPAPAPAAAAAKPAAKGDGKRKLTPAEKLAAKVAAGFGGVQTADKARAAARDQADREEGRAAEARAKLRIEEGRRKAREMRDKAGSAQHQVDSFLNAGHNQEGHYGP
jgi:hypothetical protein